jgi:hypothetical protein
MHNDLFAECNFRPLSISVQCGQTLVFIYRLSCYPVADLLVFPLRLRDVFGLYYHIEGLAITSLRIQQDFVGQ